ncbi:MAG TPA: glycosyltransferase family 4 protein, partial [Blastocatellia bacterium]|nr:glycosyltransferase family 4 protein [Blastocatellia bacterium]
FCVRRRLLQQPEASERNASRTSKMKIVQITSGAAGMYCGSCLRDNALAAELIRRGHDVVLVPTYTPTLTDEQNVSTGRVFLGGVSVYLEQHSSFFRKTPEFVDKLWDNRVVLKLAARSSIQVDPHKLGEMTVSMLKGEAGFQSKEVHKLVKWIESESPPDVINLPNSLLIGLAAPLRRATGRPIACTLQGEDLFLENLIEPYRSEARDLIRSQVESVDAFLAVSDYYVGFMPDYLEIPRNKMHVVPLGITLDGYDAGPRQRSDTFTIGFFARIAPEKGLHALCDAYRRIRERRDSPRCRLEAAGYLAPEHRDYLAEIEHKMKEWGLADEFAYRGVLDRQGKIKFLQSIDVMSVPATYGEAKGLSVLEAMAAGVPVVQPRCGSYTEMISKTGGGILVEPDDPDALADGLMQIWRDSTMARDIGRRGVAGVRDHYAVRTMADRALEVYQRLISRSFADV